MKRFILIIIILGLFIPVFVNCQTPDKPLSNPTFIYGTSLGEMIQTFYKLGKYNEMIKFTSNETIKKYGKEKVLDYYENCDFGYKLKINNKTSEGKYIILHYSAQILATNKIIRIKCVVENDTSKIVLDNLNIIYKK